MTSRDEAIRKQLSDMLAVEHFILDALERQREEDKVRSSVPVNELVIRMERTMRDHTEALQRLADDYGIGTSGWKKGISSVLGALAGLYDRVREHQLSRMIRDNYVSLSLAAMSYTALHTFGLSIKEDRIAAIAQEHLMHLTPLMVALSKVLPEVVANELVAAEDLAADSSVAATAVANTQRAWEPDVTRSP